MAEEPRKPGPVDLHVSQRLRERRIEAGMSQETLAEHLGLTFQQVQKYEKGTNRVPSGTLFRASIALGVPVAYFFEGLEGQPSSYDEDIRDEMRDPRAKSLVRAFSLIKDEGIRASVVGLVSAIAKKDQSEH